MYIPKAFLTTDQSEIISFIKKYSFGTIITVAEGKPIATHLPFLVVEHDEKMFLKSHFASVNPQAKSLEGQEILVIFTEPHAYVSPKFYEKKQNVPT